MKRCRPFSYMGRPVILVNVPVYVKRFGRHCDSILDMNRQNLYYFDINRFHPYRHDGTTAASEVSTCLG